MVPLPFMSETVRKFRSTRNYHKMTSDEVTRPLLQRTMGRVLESDPLECGLRSLGASKRRETCCGGMTRHSLFKGSRGLCCAEVFRGFAVATTAPTPKNSYVVPVEGW